MIYEETFLDNKFFLVISIACGYACAYLMIKILVVSYLDLKRKADISALWEKPVYGINITCKRLITVS